MEEGLPPEEEQHSVHIPVAEELGEHAVDQAVHSPEQHNPDTEPEQHSDDGRVEDVDKAWDMAHAGHELRSRASEERELDGRDEGVEDLHRQYSKAVHDAKSSILQPKKRGARSERVTETRKAWEEADDESSAASLEARNEFHRHFPKDEAWLDFEPEMRAYQYEERAEQLEEWAGILHDHPVHESLKRSYPEVDFSPEGLLLLEKGLEREKREYAELAKDTTVPFAETAMFNGSREQRQLYQEMLEMADKETASEFLDAGREAVIARDKANQLYAHLKERTVLRERRSSIAVKHALLLLIREGLASQEFYAFPDEIANEAGVMQPDEHQDAQ